MPSTIRQLRVFLCHASQDKSIVRELQQRLADEGWIDPWLDEKKLHPGEDWRVSIEEAVESSDSVVICLSNNSVDKEGFVQKELRYAREIALEKPEGTIFLIPLRLEDCDVPRGLRFFQWADYFGEKKEQNYTELLDSFSIRRQQIVRREQERALREAEEKEKREKEEKARKEVEELAKREAEEIARRRALEIAIKEEEERAHLLALEKAKKEAFEKALEDAREKARLEAEVYAQKEIKEKKHKEGWINFAPYSFFTIVSLLLIGLVFGIGLVGLGQLGMGPFAKEEATPTALPLTPTSLPATPTIALATFTNVPFTPTTISVQPTQTIFPSSHAIGQWTNEDSNTGGITRINIKFSGNTYSVETWGKCHPTDCYWNEYAGVKYNVSNITGSGMTIVWTFSFVETTLNLEVLSDGRLKVTSHEHFTDNSGRSDMDATYYFKKTGA
jgi:hypothetical protein